MMNRKDKYAMNNEDIAELVISNCDNDSVIKQFREEANMFLQTVSNCLEKY